MSHSQLLFLNDFLGPSRLLQANVVAVAQAVEEGGARKLSAVIML